MSVSAFKSLGSSLRILDLILIGVAFPLAIEIYARNVNPFAWRQFSGELWPVLATALATWSVSASITRLYAARFGGTHGEEMGRLLRTVAMSALALAAIGFFAKQTQLSRLLIAIYVTLVFALTLGLRTAWRVMARLTREGSGGRCYAVVGGGAMAREVVETVDAHPEWQMRLAGLISLDGAQASRGPSLGSIGELGAILEEQVIDAVIFSVPRERLDEIERGVHVCEEFGVEVVISLDVLRFGPGRMQVAEMDQVPVLTFTRTPTDSLALALKRAFDVVMSALVMVVLFPLFAAIALAIRLDSPGPVFFRQRRVGQNGRVFNMLKFRSMCQDAEKRLESLRAKNEMSGPVFKMANDPRITRLGQFLRRTSLDEFPQFWNVLKGEMSIVGPRPPVPSEVRQYKRWQRRRLSMKPGITCIWQISGRNNVDFDRWMELDLQYIDEWSLWRDVQICLKTIPAVISTRGAR